MAHGFSTVRYNIQINIYNNNNIKINSFVYTRLTKTNRVKNARIHTVRVIVIKYSVE